MAIQDVGNLMNARIEFLEQRINEMKIYIGAIEVLLDQVPENTETKEKALQLITGPKFSKIVPLEFPYKKKYLLEEVQRNETQLEALRLVTSDFLSTTVDCSLADLDGDLFEACDKLQEVNKQIMDDPNSTEANTLRIERHQIERYIGHLTLARAVFDAETHMTS